MFGINKKVETDPKKALENADKTINKGMTGFLTKTFMGKDFVDKTNASLDMAKNAMNMADASNQLAMTGVPATTVPSIKNFTLFLSASFLNSRYFNAAGPLLLVTTCLPDERAAFT